LVTGRLTQSTWLRLEIDAQGLPSIRTLTPRRLPDCSLCALLGVGDGLEWEPSVVTRSVSTRVDRVRL
jgi:hypothetical protein